MKTIFQHIKGDQTIWAIVAILAIFSFMPVYSASTNLVYVVGSGSTLGYLLKHMVLLIMGFAIIYGVHKIPYILVRIQSVVKEPHKTDDWRCQEGILLCCGNQADIRGLASRGYSPWGGSYVWHAGTQLIRYQRCGV